MYLTITSVHHIRIILRLNQILSKGLFLRSVILQRKRDWVRSVSCLKILSGQFISFFSHSFLSRQPFFRSFSCFIPSSSLSALLLIDIHVYRFNAYDCFLIIAVELIENISADAYPTHRRSNTMIGRAHGSNYIWNSSFFLLFIMSQTEFMCLLLSFLVEVLWSPFSPFLLFIDLKVFNSFFLYLRLSISRMFGVLSSIFFSC